MSQHSGPVGGGERVLITGSNFFHITSVSFGTTTARRMRVLSTTRLQVTVPKHHEGVLFVTVRGLYGASKHRRSSRFVSLGPPKLDEQSPPVGVSPLLSPIVPESWEGPNPTAECAGSGVVGLDYCGATLEGLSPLPLPANWSNLSDPQRGFVLMNLERLERGEAPMVGISTTLDEYAAAGADANTDPSGGSSIWSTGDFVQTGMPGWLYDDGPGGFNYDCTGDVTSGCFGHRDNILEDPTQTELAAGVADSPRGNSAAAVFSTAYTDFNFLWDSELTEGYPQGLPSTYTLAEPTVTALRARSDNLINITGTNLDTGTAVYFSEVRDKYRLDCSAATICTVGVPPNLAGNTVYKVYVLNPAGLSARNVAAAYTTRPQL
jgi:hypothetical protein